MFKKLAVFVLFVVVSSSTLFSYNYPVITLSALADKDYELIEVEDEYDVIIIDGKVYILEKSF